MTEPTRIGATPIDSIPADPGWRLPVNLLLLAMPIIATMISRTVMSFIDFIMVKELGTDAQAAIMPAGILLFCVISFGMGLLSVVTTFVAQALGRNHFIACSQYAWQGIWLSVLIAVTVLPAWLGVPTLFAAVGHDPNVQRMEIDYVQIGLLGIGPMLASLALANFFNGIHKPAIGLWSAIISNFFNVGANYALIFGNWGFPALGMAGAAWGTALASIVQMLILLGWMLLPRYHDLYHTRHTWRVRIDHMRNILWFGLPAGVQFTIDILTFTIFTLLLVGRFGTVQLAAHNLAFKLLEVSFMPTMGLGMAVTSAVGKVIGQGRHDLARIITRWATLFAIGYMGIIGVCYLTMRYELAGLLTNDERVIPWAADILLLCAIFQIFDALNITHISALRGAGDNHWPAVVSAIYGLTIFIGGGYLIAHYLPQYGSLGPWVAATVYIMALGITLWARFAFGPWQKIELFRGKGGGKESGDRSQETGE